VVQSGHFMLDSNALNNSLKYSSTVLQSFGSYLFCDFLKTFSKDCNEAEHFLKIAVESLKNRGCKKNEKAFCTL
jgi:hypothetical protein